MMKETYKNYPSLMQGEKGRYATQEHLLGGIKKIGTTAMSHC
jgi:hypothetical protein